MMPGFLVEEGGMEKVVIVATSLILLIILSMDRNHVTYLFTEGISRHRSFFPSASGGF